MPNHVSDISFVGASTASACLANVDDILLASVANRRRFGLSDILTVSPMISNGSSVFLARLYASMLSDVTDGDSLEATCIEAVARSYVWLELLVEMLTNLPFTPVVCRVIVGVLAKRLPDHPAAVLAERAGVVIVKAYDAVDDGALVRIDLSPTDKVGAARFGWLISIEDPASSFASCEIVEQGHEGIVLMADRQGPLFSEGRHVLPPAVFVMDEA